MRRQRRQPRQNPYRAYRGKSRWGRILSWTAGALAVLLLLLAAGAWAMFRQEWAFAGTIRRLDAPRPVYFMEIEGDYHLAISDAGGVSVAVEFTADGFTAVPTRAATNFNLAKGDTSAGGESARTRYETLLARLERGVTSPEQVRDALSAAAQPDGAWTTQWSLVYDHAAGTASWYFGGDFDARYDFQIVQ